MFIQTNFAIIANKFIQIIGLSLWNLSERHNEVAGNILVNKQSPFSSDLSIKTSGISTEHKDVTLSANILTCYENVLMIM